MKKLYYSFIILLVVVVGLVLPRAKAAGTVDLTVSHIGYIDSLQTNSTGDIVGAYVFITESYQSDIMYDVGYFFAVGNFQPDITIYGYDLLGKPLIWNPFDDRGALQKGAWWLLVDYQQMLEDILDAYNEGYYDGSMDAFDSGYSLGYDNGLADGFNHGYSVGYEVGEQLSYADGYSDGYGEGHEDGREEVLNSISEIDRELLYQDVVLPNGVKDEIINNEILVDRVGMVVFDGSENCFWDGEGTGFVLFRVYYPFNYAYEYYSDVDKAISNKFVQGYVDTTHTILSAYYMMFVGNDSLRFAILKADLIGWNDSWSYDEKVNLFKSWLAAQKEAGEPLTIWYQYEEPVEYDLVSLLTNEDGSFKDGYSEGYNDGRVHVQRENKSLLSVIPSTIGAIWLMISDFLSFEVFGLNLWAIIIVFASFSLLVLIIKMVI